jgi:hypothetical protein
MERSAPGKGPEPAGGSESAGRSAPGGRERRGRRGSGGTAGRHGPGDPPEGIGPIVRGILGAGRMRRGLALGRLSRSWAEVVGEQLARQTAPRGLDGGALLVAVASTGWGSQVRFLGPQIARRANEVLGWDAVRSVRVTVAADLSKPLGRN